MNILYSVRKSRTTVQETKENQQISSMLRVASRGYNVITVGCIKKSILLRCM